MSKQENVYGDRWRVVRELGKGGQGIVYEVEDAAGSLSKQESSLLLKSALRNATAIVHHMDDHEPFSRLADVIRQIFSAASLPKAALKELLPVDDAVNAKTALARMQNEVDALSRVSHPALVKILEAKLDQRWFVMEFFPDGPMTRQPERFQGRVLDALKAFQPVVEAVSALHKAGIIHRDIKPDNIFLRRGGELVLGDCGLAIKLEHEDRLTETYENVGSRAWMPGWAYDVRVEHVKANFDIFGLGKLLWAMVSGRPKMPLWYITSPQYDLREQFPGTTDIVWVQRILEKTVVEREEQCLGSIDDLQLEVRRAIMALDRGGQLPGLMRNRLRCRFCAIGVYEDMRDMERPLGYGGNDERGYLRCNYCGHTETFVFCNKVLPPAWQENPPTAGEPPSPASTPQADRAAVPADGVRLLQLALGELDRNVGKTGGAALALEDKHLNALIDYGEAHRWDESYAEVMKAIYDLRTRTATQKTMPRQSASMSHAHYQEAARAIMQRLRELLTPQ